jgi:hypothetical protein
MKKSGSDSNLKTDTSRILYDKYYRHSNRNVEIVLKDGRRIHGVIAGFFSADAENVRSPIHHWHIINGMDQSCLTGCILGFEQGEVIRHRDIATVIFDEDHSTISF